MKLVVRCEHTSKYFPATRRKTPSPHPLLPDPSFCPPPMNASSPAYSVWMKVCLLELSETQCSGSQACMSRPSGWMEAKTFVILSTPIFLWKHSSGGLWPQEGWSTKFIYSLYWKLMLSFGVTFSLISLVLILHFPAGRAWSHLHIYPGGPRCVHIFWIVIMHHQHLSRETKSCTDGVYKHNFQGSLGWLLTLVYTIWQGPMNCPMFKVAEAFLCSGTSSRWPWQLFVIPMGFFFFFFFLLTKLLIRLQSYLAKRHNQTQNLLWLSGSPSFCCELYSKQNLCLAS